MPVPLLDMSLQHQSLLPEMAQAFEEIVRSGGFILGPGGAERFEKDLAKYCGCAHAIGLTSGTDALLVALMALEINPGDEVILPPFTFFATAGSVARLGAKPVFVDVEPGTFNLDPNLVERAITSRTRVIMPVHLFGQCADMGPIMDIARRKGLRVVEDVAQAIGARDGEKLAGSMGDIGAFSFYPTKNLAALGDAGACTTNDPALAKRIGVIRVHGQTGEYQHEVIGGNFRLDALKAAMLSIKLPHLPAWTEARRSNAKRYDKLLANLPVERPVQAQGKYHVFNQYTLRIPGGKRDALKKHLAARDIGHRVYYPLPLHLQPCFKELGYQRGSFPVSERLAGEVLSIPIFPELTEVQAQEVVGAVRSFFA